MRHTRRLLTTALALLLCLGLAAPAAAKEYTVRSGDSLWKIAQSQLGNGNRWGEIYEANRSAIRNPQVIYPGQTLWIPDGAEPSAQQPETPAQPEPPTGQPEASPQPETPTGEPEASPQPETPAEQPEAPEQTQAAESTQQPEAESAPLLYQVEMANTVQQLYERHSSVRRDFSVGEGLEPEDFTTYVSPELLVSMGGSYQGLLMEGMGLELVEGSPVTTVFLDESDYMVSVRELWESVALSFANEELLEGAVQDGVFTLLTRQADPEIVSELLEEYGCPRQGGEVLLLRYDVDAETLDVLEQTIAVQTPGGQERQLGRNVYTYDTEYDLEGSPFGPWLDATRRPVTLTYAPGQDRLEVSKSFSVRKGNFTVISEGKYVEEYYTDPECTKPYAQTEATADTSELHLYVKSGYTTAGAEAQDLYTATLAENDFEGRMERHSSLDAHTYICYQGEPVLDYETYADRERNVFMDHGSFYRLVDPGAGRFWEAGSNGRMYWLFMESRDALAQAMETMVHQTDTNALESEQVFYTREEEGMLILLTEVEGEPVREFVNSRMEQFDLSDFYQEGMRLRSVCCFDPETMDYLGQFLYCVEADNTPHLVTYESYVYDVDPPLETAFTAPFLTGEDLRSVAVVYNPGSPEEATVSAMVPRGMVFDVLYQGAAVPDFYADPACTQVFDYKQLSTVGDVTVYYQAES